MGENTPPRPATELFPESLKLSPKQREVLRTLQELTAGARASDVADALGMHVNTARGHLDELVAHGAVRVFPAPAQGRGRPSLIFQVRVPDNRTVADEYVTLIEMMADTIDPDSARDIGRRWARRMAEEGHEPHDVDSAAARIHTMLRDMGFDPTLPEHPDTPDSTTLTLQSCPFVTATGERPSDFVCRVHDGFLAETVSDGVDSHVEPMAANGQCLVHLSRQAKN